MPRLAVFIIFVLFLPSSGLIHLVFRRTRESNSHPRTMAQTVSPRCSPLDQGASWAQPSLFVKFWNGEYGTKLHQIPSSFILRKFEKNFCQSSNLVNGSSNWDINKCCALLSYIRTSIHTSMLLRANSTKFAISILNRKKKTWKVRDLGVWLETKKKKFPLKSNPFIGNRK